MLLIKKLEKNIVEQLQEIDIDISSMKQCLAQGYPFIFSLQLFHSFNQVDSSGQVFIPNLNQEKSSADHGIHGMLCVG